MDGLERTIAEWQAGRCWGPLAPCDHVLQVYDDDAALLDSLEGYAVDGLDAGEGVLVVATAPHRESFVRGLAARGVDVEAATAADRLILVSAQEMLDRIMLHGSPDESLFETVAGELLARARGEGRRVRAFGEMVALLWARGNQPAAIRLECLWNRAIRREGFPLFCAYPRFGFTEELVLSVDAVCSAHTRIVG